VFVALSNRWATLLQPPFRLNECSSIAWVPATPGTCGHGAAPLENEMIRPMPSIDGWNIL